MEEQRDVASGNAVAVPAVVPARKVKWIRYRLEGEHDRFLADWEAPARKALQVRFLCFYFVVFLSCTL